MILRYSIAGLLIAILTIISGCAGKRISEIIGYRKTPPDEFSVAPTPSLTLPPDYTLKPPQQAGASAPSINTSGQASSNAKMSHSEAKLLQSLDAQAAQDSVRASIDRETRELDSQRGRSFFDWLSGRDSAENQSESVVDPTAEAERLRRLQTSGDTVSGEGAVITPPNKTPKGLLER